MIILRDALQANWADLFAWRNDETTRKACLQTEPITLVDHLKWLEATLGDKTQRVFVAEDVEYSAKIGMGRLIKQKSAPNSKMARVELTLAVAPEWRGRGHANRIVTALMIKASTWVEGPLKLTAVVREENARSLRAFAAAGFVVDRIATDEPTGRIVHLSYVARQS